MILVNVEVTWNFILVNFITKYELKTKNKQFISELYRFDKTRIKKDITQKLRSVTTKPTLQPYGAAYGGWSNLANLTPPCPIGVSAPARPYTYSGPATPTFLPPLAFRSLLFNHLIHRIQLFIGHSLLSWVTSSAPLTASWLNCPTRPPGHIIPAPGCRGYKNRGCLRKESLIRRRARCHPAGNYWWFSSPARLRDDKAESCAMDQLFRALAGAQSLALPLSC